MRPTETAVPSEALVPPTPGGRGFQRDGWGRGLLLGLLFLLPACQDFGAGGTGELVLSEQTRREIQAVTPDSLAHAVPAAIQPPPAAAAPVEPPPAELTLTLPDIRQSVLANNLDLQVILFNPAQAREALHLEDARFEPLFTTSATYSEANQPTSSSLESAESVNVNLTPGLQIPLRTGGSVSLNLPMDRSWNNNPFTTLNPAYSTQALVSLSQPLLRNAGNDANAYRMRIAFYQQQQSEVRTKLEVIRLLAEADRMYWRLYAAREALLVRVQEHELALAQLERARRQVKAEVLPEVDVLRAQSGVADRAEMIISADRLLRQRERNLKRIMNRSNVGIDSPTILHAGSLPDISEFRMDPAALTDKALSQRLELVDAQLQLARESAAVANARNGALPLVLLQYQYGVTGLGEDFGPAWEMTRRFDHDSHRVGLRLEVPLGNAAAESNLRSALLGRLQQLSTQEAKIAQIRQEIFDAVDNLTTLWQHYQAALLRKSLAARVLEGEIRQFDVGLRTSNDVLNAQARLAAAKLDEISAVADYQIALIDLAYATGSILGASHVTWSPRFLPASEN